MTKKFCYLLIFIVLMVTSGCMMLAGIPVDTTNGVQPVVPQASAVSENIDAAAKELLSEYFTVLFTAPSVDVYTEYTRMGRLPDTIMNYISEKTIQEGNGNPEIGIHLPRYISINGMTIIGYDLVLLGEEATPDITSGFVGMNGDNLLYFCKIVTKARVVPNEVFEECYIRQDNNTYIIKNNISQSDIDGMRVEVRYDVELENKDGKLKVLRAIESNIKPGLKNRLFILNNESITRLQYLNLTRTPDGSAYINPADGEIYEEEKAVITAFFENLVNLDRERMNLLSHKWEKGYQEVKVYWESLNITKNADHSEIIQLTEDYADFYPYESLPLRFNMQKIKEIQNVIVNPHPAYSEKTKWYFVHFDAIVQRTNGITDDDFIYRYDYLVVLSEENSSTVIKRIKLNEYYTIQDKQ